MPLVAPRRFARRLAFLAIVFAIAAVVGARLDWLWWVSYTGIMLTLGAMAILLVGLVLAVIGRATHRSPIGGAALGAIAVGVGLLAGQAFGPTREPFVYQSGGTMTLHLTAPVVGDATGVADCRNVASGTEFAVDGDSNMRLETPEAPFLSVALDSGDRWQAYRAEPRKNGVWFVVFVTGQMTPTSGKPDMVTYAATSASTLESTFTNAGGSIRFAGVGAEGPATSDGSAPPLAGSDAGLAGTLEWTCGPVV
jgi:hypothetical protein